MFDLDLDEDLDPQEALEEELEHDIMLGEMDRFASTFAGEQQ